MHQTSSFKAFLILTIFITASVKHIYGQITIDILPNDLMLNCYNTSEVQTWIDDYILQNGASTGCSSGSDISWTHDYDSTLDPVFEWGDFCSGEFIVQFTATDECGDSDMVTGSVYLEDMEAPQFISYPSDLFVSCDGSDLQVIFDDWIQDNLNLEVSDNCIAEEDIDIAYNCYACPLEDDFFCETFIDVEFSITDNCGNSEIFYAFFEIDMIEPVLEPPSISSHTFVCDGQGNSDDINDLIANDFYVTIPSSPCDGSPTTLMIFPDPEGYNFICGETHYFDVSVEDVCGFQSESHSVEITIFESNISFSSSNTSLGEAAGSLNVCLSIEGPHPDLASYAEVTLLVGTNTATNGEDFENIAETQSLTFPAGSTEDVCFELQIIDDILVESLESASFEITNVSGGYEGIVGEIGTHEVSINDNDDNDGDGIENSIDNCPEDYNPLQEDIDDDGIGNVCDDDNYVEPLSVVQGDIYINQVYSGLIVRSPDGGCWIITVGNDGSLQTVSLDCPE